MNENSFYSIDHLIEFGMGMAIAQQMVKTMNQSIETMKVPGTFPNYKMPAIEKYYAVINGSQCGPYSQNELLQLIKEKKIVNETYVWKPGMKHWDIAQNLPDIVQLVALVPPPLPDNI